MVNQLRDEEVSPAELARAKKQKAAELVFQHQRVQQQAESLGISYLSADDPLFDSHYTDRIQKVTAAEIREAARKYFVPARLNRVIIAPPGGAPKGPAAERESGSGKVHFERLPNGLRVLVKRVPNLPLVNIQAHVLGGSSTDGEKLAGRAAMLADLLDKGTTRGASAADIAAFFDLIGGELSFSAGRFTFNGSATCLKEDFPKAAALFADSLLYPALPEDQFMRAKMAFIAGIENRSTEAEAEAQELFLDSLPDTSPYHVNPGGKVTTINRLTVAELKKLHDEWFLPGNMVVTVFGDIEPAAAMAIVKEHFGGPGTRSRVAGEREPVAFPADSNALAESKTVNKATGKETAMLIMAFACEGIYDKEDHAAMTVLRAILNGYSTPGGWLHNELRGEGLIYYIFTHEMTGPVPGYFVITSQPRADKLDEVVTRIRRNLDKAKHGDISDGEFRTAIEQIIGLHAQENVTIAEQARTAAVDELLGLGYDYDAKFDAQIRAVTKADVVRVARKYLTKSLLVTTTPKK